MSSYIFQITLLVNDYDEAIDFYTQKLNFTLIEDTVLSAEKRWVVIAPNGATQKGCNLLLAKAANEAQQKAVGNQTGGRVFLFLQTNDFEKDYEHLLKNKVTIVRPPVVQPYGKVVVFEDLYGNLFDMIGKM